MSTSPEAPDIDPEVMESLVFFRSEFGHPPNVPQSERQRQWVHTTIDKASEEFALGTHEADERGLDELYSVDTFRLARAMHERPMNAAATERLRRLRVDYDDCVASAMPPLMLIPSHGQQERMNFNVADLADEQPYGASRLTEIIDSTARALLRTLVDDADHQLPHPDHTLKTAEPFVQTLYAFWFSTAYYYLSRAEDFSSTATPPAAVVEPPQAA